jgi:histidine decarboxylase
LVADNLSISAQALNADEWPNQVKSLPIAPESPYDPWSANEQRYPAGDQQQRLNELLERFVERSAHYIGFPNSRILDFSSLAPFLKFNINNIGDPFHPNAGINTCDFEREIIAFFAEIFSLPLSQGWGYLTNGGTEGNMYGIVRGRDAYPDAQLIFSEESHYSLTKIAHLLRMPHTVVPCHGDGRIDLEALAAILAALDGRPCVINLNVGTTFHGAIESPEAVLKLLDAKGCKDFYLHIDAALDGPMLPFLAGAPCFDFRLPINSLSFSGHKFLGSPIPCGLVLCDRKRDQHFGSSAEYVGSVDTTISGSRDGFSTLILWSLISRLKQAGLAELAQESLRLADYAVDRLHNAGIACIRHPHSNIVVFRKPGPQLASHWQLATRGDFAHLVTVPGVTEEMLKIFVNELAVDLKIT